MVIGSSKFISLFSYLILFFGLIFQANSQSFEGVITYSVEFDLEGRFLELKDQVLNKLREEGSNYDSLKVYIKGERYMKVDNSVKQKRIIYDPDTNKIYTFEKGSEYVGVLNAGKTMSLNMEIPVPTIQKVDSAISIRGIECEVVTMNWGNFGEEWYFYNPEIAQINTSLFNSHQFEGLSQLLGFTGVYPIGMVKGINNAITIKIFMTAIEERSLSNDLFTIPELKKGNKKANELMNVLSGGEIMKLKN